MTVLLFMLTCRPQAGMSVFLFLFVVFRVATEEAGVGSIEEGSGSRASSPLFHVSVFSPPHLSRPVDEERSDDNVELMVPGKLRFGNVSRTEQVKEKFFSSFSSCEKRSVCPGASTVNTRIPRFLLAHLLLLPC